jgi:hypothetical protein
MSTRVLTFPQSILVGVDFDSNADFGVNIVTTIIIIKISTKFQICWFGCDYI